MFTFLTFYLYFILISNIYLNISVMNTLFKILSKTSLFYYEKYIWVLQFENDYT